MIALGVDFAVHAIRRYQEEKAIGYAPRRALRIGFAGVLGALVLAMLSDGIAFPSNAASEIEAIIHFGVAAAIAAASSFLVLGVIVPLATMRIDQLRPPRPGSATLVARIITLTSAAGVAALTGASVLFLVVGFAIPGVVILLATIVGFLVIPIMIMRRRNRGLELQEDSFTSPINTQAGGSENLMVGACGNGPCTLPVPSAAGHGWAHGRFCTIGAQVGPRVGREGLL